MRVAIIGSGIAGLGAAWALHRQHDITVFERESRPGGHSYTVDVDYAGTRIAVDIGFIVYNELNYPNLTALFGHLGVDTVSTRMTFGFSSRDGRLEWQGNTVGSLFAQKSNVLRPSFHRMWLDIFRFRREALADAKAGRLEGLSLGDYIARNRYSDAFRDDCLLPMGAAIWSTGTQEMLGFPAQSFVQFFENHRLFYFDKPLWRTVRGGSREYVKKLTAPFADRIRLASPVASVSRNDAGATVTLAGGAQMHFDQVIMACHSDEALRLLADPTPSERSILGDMRYAPNRVYLHRDPALMPRRKAVWSSWNYLARSGADGAAVSVTYWMNELQPIDRKFPLFVSLNPPAAPDPSLTFGEWVLHHPQFDSGALAAQRKVHEIQGARHTWFCGAWAGYGFHEDGLTSGLEVAERLGAVLPWGRIASPRMFPEIRQAAE